MRAHLLVAGLTVCFACSNKPQEGPPQDLGNAGVADAAASDADPVDTDIVDAGDVTDRGQTPQDTGFPADTGFPTDCAVGGNAIERWNDPANDRNLWAACIQRKIPDAGLRPDQVRVVYHKAANQSGDSATFYPDPASDYFAFIANLGTFATRVSAFFPSVTAVYTTSRSYGGFTSRPERGEPRSYEEGHALNTWLATNGNVGGVWHGWGPYIWAPDCTTGETNGSSVCCDRADYQNDGVHPVTGARDKISGMIHAHFSQHAWYRP